MENIYTVYWYKRPIHTNPYTEGYIGITKNMRKRNISHKTNTKVSHFTNAMKLYNDIEYTMLHTNVTLQEASDLEYAYRPDTNIGWNAAIGGADVLATRAVPITMYHETDPDKLYNFKSITEAAEVLNLTEGRISQAKSRNRQIYGYDGWAIILDDLFDRKLTKNMTQIASERLLGVKKEKPSHFKGVTNRWSDEDKARIGAQHKGKKNIRRTV